MRKPTAAILAFAAAYWGWMIFVQSRVLDGKRWFVLFDDAMISMRYAANAARGMGLVFNAGERVEGFTNPLWTGLMVAVHLVEKDHALTSLWVSIAGACLLGGAVVQAGRLAAILGGSELARLSAMIATAVFYPLVFWSLHGMEVSALAFLCTWAVVKATEALQRNEVSVAAAGMLAIAMLVRADAAVIAAALLAVTALLTRDWRRSLLCGALVFASAAGQTAARLAYYGDVVPNTYYLKMQGIPAGRRALYGFGQLRQWLDEIEWLPAILPLLAPAVRRSRLLAPAMAAMLAQVAYDVWIGGDAFEGHDIGANRFLSTVAPIAIALLVVVCLAIADRSRAAALGAVAASVLIAIGPVGEDRLRTVAGLQRDGDTHASLHWLRQALALERVIPKDARIAVTGAGTLPYFLLDHYVIDILGKMDKRIAHLPMRPVTAQQPWRPGHMKFDQEWSIGQLRPDVVAGWWQIDGELQRNYRWDEATGSFFRKR